MFSSPNQDTKARGGCLHHPNPNYVPHKTIRFNFRVGLRRSFSHGRLALASPRLSSSVLGVQATACGPGCSTCYARMGASRPSRPRTYGGRRPSRYQFRRYRCPLPHRTVPHAKPNEPKPVGRRNRPYRFVTGLPRCIFSRPYVRFQTSPRPSGYSMLVSSGSDPDPTPCWQGADPLLATTFPPVAWERRVSIALCPQHPAATFALRTRR